MPYLWDPEHSTAQLVDLVTKDPNEYRLFAMMPLLLSSAAFSLSVVMYAQPIITPAAVLALFAYKYVKKPFGWGIRQVCVPFHLANPDRTSAGSYLPATTSGSQTNPVMMLRRCCRCTAA